MIAQRIVSVFVQWRKKLHDFIKIDFLSYKYLHRAITTVKRFKRFTFFFIACWLKVYSRYWFVFIYLLYKWYLVGSRRYLVCFFFISVISRVFSCHLGRPIEIDYFKSQPYFIKKGKKHKSIQLLASCCKLEKYFLL